METSFEPDYQLSINTIYLSLSVEDGFEFDTKEYLNFITNTITVLFDKNFLQEKTEDLYQKPMLLNQKFVELIKYCKTNYSSHNVGYIFVQYCDYFDLEPHKVFKMLHEKLQTVIKEHTRRITGDEIINSIEKKLSSNRGYYVPTLFQIVK